MTYFPLLAWQFLPFLSGYLVVPGAGIDDDDDDKEDEPGGVGTGCVEHVVVAGWGSCFIWGVEGPLWAGDGIGTEPEPLSAIWIYIKKTHDDEWSLLNFEHLF